MVHQKRLCALLAMLLLVTTFPSFGAFTTLSIDEDDGLDPFIWGGLAWSPDGQTIAVGTSMGIRLHNASDLSPIRQLGGSTFVGALDWHPDGISLATSGDGIKVWDVETGELRSHFSETVGAYSLAWSPDGTLLAGGMGDDTLRVWDRETGEEQFAVEIDTGVGIRYSVTWSADSRYLGAKRQGDFAIWDITTGQIKLTWLYDRFADVTAWSPDGEYFASAGSDEPSVKLWDPTTGELMAGIDAGLDTSITPWALVWSPDTTHLAIAVRAIRNCCEIDGWIEVWNVESGELETTLPDVIMIGDGRYNNALAYSDDGSKLASISDDGKVYIWDATTYEQVAVYDGYTPIWDVN